MKILLATDFTETATRASEIAIAIAKLARDELALLHVGEPPTHSVLELATDARAYEQALRDRDRADLRASAAEVRALGVTVQEHMASGDPAEVIVSTAREVGARLIVLGSHGRRAPARLILGSVAQETLLRADRPVLVARRGGSAHGFADWANGVRPLRVTLAVDKSPASAAAAAWVRGLRGLGPIDLRLVHVYDPTIEALRLGLYTRPAAGLDIEATLGEELRVLASELLEGGQATLALRAFMGRPGEVVARDAEEAGADLLVLGTHSHTRAERLWLGATAELAVRRARVPVVCVPAPTSPPSR